ncbi:MAG: hypothetical protein ACRD2Z_09770 [Thermoanaerobaculia bacterium]
MTLRLVEPAVDALRDRLEAALPAEIEAINAEAAAVADGYTIEGPQLVLDYVPNLDLLNQFPTVAIANEGTGRFEDDNAWSATGLYELGVVSFIQDADQQALVRRLRRYTLAVTRVALDDRNLGSGTGIPWGVVLKRINYGPALADTTGLREGEPPNAYLSFSVVTIEVKLDED